MIVNKPHSKDARPVDAPPSYDDLARQDSSTQQQIPDAKQPPSMTTQQYTVAGPSYTTSEPVVYNYVNPTTGELVRSFLPPDHPTMICLQAGKHVPHTKFGVLGILAAVFWFPLGVGLCLLDRKVQCTRCGEVLNE